MQSFKQQGNILITALVLVALLSLSTLYIARESLWSMNLAKMQADTLQLDLLTEEALTKTEHLIKNLPEAFIPVEIQACAAPVCILSTQQANVFLEQTLAQWLEPSYPIPVKLNLSLQSVHAWVILEHLSTTPELQQYFRATILLLQQSPQRQLRMQATWKKATLKNDINQVDSLTRLARR